MIERIQKWDLLKFFLIFCVVLGHFADLHTSTNVFARGIYLFVYTFHMPLFIFVSGLFSKRMVNEKKWDKIVGYLVLFFAAKVLTYVLNAIILHKSGFSVLRESGVPWFMFALFVFATVTVFASRYKPAYVLTFSVLLSLMAGYDGEINNTFVLARIIALYPFYYIGYCCDIKKLEQFSSGKIKKVCAAIIIGVFIWAVFNIESLYIIRPMLVFQHTYDKLNDFADFGPLVRLFCYVLSVVVGACIVILTPNKIGKSRIAKLGQYTLPVYMLHYSLMRLIYIGLNTVGVTKAYIEDKMIWIIFPLALLLTLLLSNKWLNSIALKILNIPKAARKVVSQEKENKSLTE